MQICIAICYLDIVPKASDTNKYFSTEIHLQENEG